MALSDEITASLCSLISFLSFSNIQPLFSSNAKFFTTSRSLNPLSLHTSHAPMPISTWKILTLLSVLSLNVTSSGAPSSPAQCRVDVMLSWGTCTFPSYYHKGKDTFILQLPGQWLSFPLHYRQLKSRDHVSLAHCCVPRPGTVPGTRAESGPNPQEMSPWIRYSRGMSRGEQACEVGIPSSPSPRTSHRALASTIFSSLLTIIV